MLSLAKCVTHDPEADELELNDCELELEEEEKAESQELELENDELLENEENFISTWEAAMTTFDDPLIQRQ